MAMCSDPIPAHDLYTTLKVPNGGSSCCNDRDCREVPWRELEGAIEFLVDGFWIRPERHNLLPAIDGSAHACWSPRSPGLAEQPPAVRCLIPPSIGA